MRKIEGGPLGGGAGEVKAGVGDPGHLRMIMRGIEARLTDVRGIRLRPAPDGPSSEQGEEYDNRGIDISAAISVFPYPQSSCEAGEKDDPRPAHRDRGV